MRLVRGRAADPEADRAVTDALVRDAADSGEPALRVWTPHRTVAFGRRDAREDGFGAAKRAAEERGYRPLERSVGGRAVAYTGETTLAFARAAPVTDEREGLHDRYEGATSAVLRALRAVGATARRGEPERSFCPGQHSIRADGKFVGVAQRVTRGAALLAGCVLVAEREELRDVLGAVYGELGAAFDPGSVGSVEAAGGPAEPDAVREALEGALGEGGEGGEPTVERVGGG